MSFSTDGRAVLIIPVDRSFSAREPGYEKKLFHVPHLDLLMRRLPTLRSSCINLVCNCSSLRVSSLFCSTLI